ncbi:NAD(P)/FAD-dependent oxidoreductase [Streptomyces sp. B6B3]|uniref:phytoene desaturase family protein n=1 Tax=Streptomyces sp. B6B3 TaxID=3153570 RepID=UPI00325E4D19
MRSPPRTGHRRAPRRESMIIIGGGLGGLSTGCYAQMNGYHSRIFEMHESPGGSCTAWDRGDYTFDWCVSWLPGSGPGTELYQIWLELGALQGKEMRHFDVLNVVRGQDGRTVYFYSDPDRLQAHLTELAPGDARRIRAFCDDLRALRKLLSRFPVLKPVGVLGRRERWRRLAAFAPRLAVVRRSLGTLMTDYAARFADPLLREAFTLILYEEQPDLPVLPFQFRLASHANLAAGVPEGGSLGLARSVERRYLRLGGLVAYDARVDEVLVDGDQAVGVRLSDGSEHRADIVVSACDGHTTAMRLLRGRYLNDFYRRLYTETIDEPGVVSPGYFGLFLGLNRPFPEADPCTTYLLPAAVAARLTGIRTLSLHVQFRSRHYPELSPGETDIVFASYVSDTEPWRGLSEGPERVSRGRRGAERHTLPVRRGRDYQLAKRQARDALVDFLDERFPGLRDAVVVRDTSTPLTQLRYTGNYNGSFPGWRPFVASGDAVAREMRKRGPVLPGLRNFYLSGVWATVGGLGRAATAGRQVMQCVCRDDGRPFTASVDDAAPPPTHVVLPVGARPAAVPPPLFESAP